MHRQVEILWFWRLSGNQIKDRLCRAASLCDAVLMDGCQRRIGHARNIHIVKPDDGNIFRNACAAFAQTCHNCGGILVAADTDAGKILPRGELTSQRNASFSIEGVKIVDEKIRSWRDARFAQRVAVAHITLIVVHEAAVNRRR